MKPVIQAILKTLVILRIDIFNKLPSKELYNNMKIITTATILIVTLLAVPVISYFSGTSLGNIEWGALYFITIIAAIVAALTFILGEVTNNNSQVDKIWSLMPIVYVWVVADYAHYNPRLVLMGILVTIWGLRLTYNFGLKGAYQWRFWSGEEDYRWKILRQKPEFQPRWKWTLFNFFFISGYQNALILLITLPTIIALQGLDTPLGIMDYTAAFLMIFFIGYETIADAQHWRFQKLKYAKINAGEKLSENYQKGFLDRGLWAWSRHPNYFAEQAIWICFYLFSVAASGQWINWSITGCLLLIILFMGSSNFSENISAGKYHSYATYQQKVPRFFPFGGFKK